MAVAGRWMLWTLAVHLHTLQGDALTVNMRESNLEVLRGDAVTLPCSFFTSDPVSQLNVIWTVVPFSSTETPTQVIVYDHGQVMEDPSFIGRVGFAGIPWSADIVLNETRGSDAGVYRCMVNNPPETTEMGIGELTLSVLSPPSLPVCQWDGPITEGGSVTLSCSVDEGIPTPEIEWDKLSPEEIPLPVNMDGDMSGSAQILNVSSQTSGLYRCSASNALGTEHCYVNLSIYRTPDSPSGILQGVLLTLSMSLLLLALLLLITWLHRTGQDGRTRVRDEEGDETRYKPSLMKRSFV
ncbi:unnamed protein product [Knipowitschia caucasica]|uniref:Ig-like domain-containing protein n=1 Tax=Knipowitschia caucasica TaxID=637954 RepID=A0AAV2J7H0_KNICA